MGRTNLGVDYLFMIFHIIVTKLMRQGIKCKLHVKMSRQLNKIKNPT